MNYNSLKSDIAAVVRENGNQEITGENLQGVLTEMIDNSVGTGYLYKGIATPETQGGTPDQNVFYLAGAGTYGNFGGAFVVPVGMIGVFSYNGEWSLQLINNDIPLLISCLGTNALFSENGYYDANGTLVYTNSARHTPIMPTGGNNFLYYTTSIGASGAEVVFFDSNKEYIPSLTIVGNNTFVM